MANSQAQRLARVRVVSKGLTDLALVHHLGADHAHDLQCALLDLGDLHAGTPAACGNCVQSIDTLTVMHKAVA